MFSAIRKTFGLIKVTQLEEEVFVDGVPGYFISKDINNLWRSSKISSYMFNKITRNTFSIPNFFLLDLLYILETIVSSKKSLGTSKYTSQKIIDALKEATWLGNLDKPFDDRLDFSKVSLFWKTPLEFQKNFFTKYNEAVTKYDLKGYLLAGTAGSGKTYTSLVLTEMLHSDYTIVVCPANATYNVWYSAITKEGTSEYKKPRASWIMSDNVPYNGERYLICHYEALNKLLQMVGVLKGKITIILDECHNLNNDENTRSLLFVDLCEKTKSQDILWCSGTPIKAMGSETITLFRTISKNFNDHLKLKYKKLFGKDAKKALDILANRLDIMSHKVEKKELNLKDPIIVNLGVKAEGSDSYTLDKIKDEMLSFIDQQKRYYSSNFSKYSTHYKKCVDLYVKTIKTETENKEYEQYKRLVKKFTNNPGYYEKEETSFCNKFEQTRIIPIIPKDWKELFLNAKSVVKYVDLKIQGECLGRILGKRRMECAKLVCENIDYVQLIESTEKKTVVFTSYVEVVEKAKDVMEQLGLTPAVVYAKTNYMLSEIIDKFQHDKNVNPLIATFNSLSTAVPLTMADVMIMVNSPFRDYILQQAISRIHRLGATTEPYVYIAYLDTGDKPNLSTRTIDILKWSQAQVTAIMGIESPFLINEENVSLENISSDYKNGNEEFRISLEELEEKQFII